MGRLVQVLGFLINRSRIAIKTGRIILLLSPEGHLIQPEAGDQRGVGQQRMGALG